MKLGACLDDYLKKTEREKIMRKPEFSQKAIEAEELWLKVRKAFDLDRATDSFSAEFKELFKAFRSVEKDGKSLDEVVALCREKLQKNSAPAKDVVLDQTAQKLLDLGCTVWRGGDKARIFINRDFFKVVFGLDCDGKKAFLNGEKISNNQAHKYTSNKIFYCLNTGKFIGTSLVAII